MSTFAYAEPGIKAWTKSPNSKKSVLQCVQMYTKENKTPPETLQFTVWDPVDPDFMFGLQTAHEDETVYIQGTELFVLDILPITGGMIVELGKPKEE